MAPKKRTMPLAEKMKFPVGIGSGHFSFFLSADNVYFSLVAGSTLTLSADRGCVRPNFFCGTGASRGRKLIGRNRVNLIVGWLADHF